MTTNFSLELHMHTDDAGLGATHPWSEDAMQPGAFDCRV